jgi:uncharacterized protein (TIGR03067 family)
MIRNLWLIPAVWLLLAIGGTGAEPKKEGAVAKELAKLQGKWKLVEEHRDGSVTKYEDGHVLTIEKQFMLWYDADEKVDTKHSLKLDPSKSPKEMDETILFNRVFPDANGNTKRCIYQLKGDELKIARPYAPYQNRPKEFTTKAGSRFKEESQGERISNLV